MDRTRPPGRTIAERNKPGQPQASRTESNEVFSSLKSRGYIVITGHEHQV
jgi:tRNA splicing endonuclease